MTESINNEVFFYHSKGDERSSFHLKLMVKVILYGCYSKKVNPREGLKIYSAKIFPQSGSQLDKKSTNVQQIATVLIN